MNAAIALSGNAAAAGENDLPASDSVVLEVAAAPRLEEALIARALQAGEQAGRPVYEVLAEASGLSGERYAAALAAEFDYRFIPAEELAVLEPDFSLLPPAEATRRNCVVVREQQQLIAVFTDPFDQELRGWLELRISEPLEWALAAREELANLIVRRAEALRAIDSVLPSTQAAARSEEGVDNLSYVRISEDTSPVVRLVHSTVYDALRAGASDIHLESSAIGVTVRYRLDGVLVDIAAVRGVELAEQIISRIKVMSELDIAERRVPQDGRFKIAVNGRPIDFRVSIIPSIFGEDAVLRILDKQALTKMIGLRLDVLSRFLNMGVEPYHFVSALNCIMAQRLVRIICEQCSEAYMPARELLEESRLSVVLSASFKFRKGRGCGHCRGTGYHGRKAVGELMVLNDEIREAIVSRVPVRQLKELASQAGVQLIRNAALELVRRGQTTIEEVNRVTIMA